jgi:hypothetical protein
VSLVVSKSTKQRSIPRLEWLGAVILARLTKKFKDILREIDTIHWVDSTAVLCWIKNDQAWKQYVRNRVMEIRSLTSIESWRFCPGTQNPIFHHVGSKQRNWCPMKHGGLVQSFSAIHLIPGPTIQWFKAVTLQRMLRWKWLKCLCNEIFDLYFITAKENIGLAA